ncbi:hypothetical protein NADFUDRAFT_82845 [Nadsonia fulvescens var. elongata DSM 6958]|uniref:Uncharacterized protein n=1 Tax=Nadsonia fulvescens var. elongata DSM 6958 TaxID=857566 RepID=A0A1E3PLV3_9ASCO|nr:hypothetical protein NADFUDRAFT_82845 [Nadsonia fulvescens var. elongata DSM 6958]
MDLGKRPLLVMNLTVLELYYVFCALNSYNIVRIGSCFELERGIEVRANVESARPSERH